MTGSRKERVPSYCRHKASNRGYARFQGQARPTYFPGPYGSAESRAAYDRELAAWLARGRRPAVQAAGLAVAELVAAWLSESERLFRDRDSDRPSAEHRCQLAAVRPLLALYADTPAAEFAPPMLRLVRSRMAGLGWAEGTIRRHLSRIKSIFAWGVDEGLLPAAVHGALVARRRRKGRDGAPTRPTKPRAPADPASVAAVVESAHPTLSAMVEVQRLIGCRPGDLVIIRPCDLDTSAEVWRYTPESHKTAHHGHALCYWLGPRAQAILRPFLHGREPGEYVFRSPWARTAKRYTAARYARQLDDALNRVNARRKAAGLAPLPRFTAHTLRHAKATEVRDTYGVEAAGAVLGHRSIRATEVYTSTSAALARKIAAETG